jgi:hypothetical protein
MKKNYKNACQSIHMARVGFKAHFNIDAIRFMDPLMTAALGRYNLAIINFDDWLHQQGYSEEAHGSMKKYIYSHYGKDAMDFIISLLLTRPRRIKRRAKKNQEM